MQSLFRRATLAIACVGALLAAPAAAQAQSGRITGSVSDEVGNPLSNAQVTIVGTRLSTTTSASGDFSISVPAGSYTVRVLMLGFKTYAMERIAVEAGGERQMTVTMAKAPTALDAVVVSASRQPERLTDAPATVSVVDAAQIENSVGNSFGGALKAIKGIDYIQTGMTSAAINARGFNSSFNNRMLMMEEGRIAVLPENGLPVGQFTTINKLDLASVEVLVGPGAALYGPDASNGVLTLVTKDPKQFPGQSAEVSGGTREFKNVQFRQAAVHGNIGYKFSGEFLQANEFNNRMRYGPAAGRTDSTDEVGVDWRAGTRRASGAVVWYRQDSRLEFNSGFSLSDGVGQTNVGRNQLKNWMYNHQQVKWSTKSWFANAYRTQSRAGDSYAINRYSQNRVITPNTITDDSVKKLSDWPSDGRMYAAEIQNNFRVPQLLNTRITWGSQFRFDQVSSGREWLDDRETGKDLTMQQVGGYAQVETPLTEQFRIVVAGRYDKHSDYDAQFSPKAALLFKPTPEQTLRATYSKAFKSPTTLQNHFNIVDFVPFVGVFGNQKGFTIKTPTGEMVGTIDPLRSEENQTFEVGYKAVIGTKLYVDAAVYDARYNHFMTPLIIIANPYAGASAAWAYQGTNTTPIRNANGLNQIVLTYRNLGKARILGLDAGLRYLVTDRITFSASTGLIKRDTIEIPETIVLSPAQRTELSSLNSPSVRWAAGAEMVDVLPRLTAGFTVRHSQDYFFASGINVGQIPTFTTLDINAAYRIRRANATAFLQVNNLFTCAKERPNTGADKGCGFDNRHIEMYNMPAVGTMAFLGLRVNRQ
jgi:outer membrane receptor for ferrienterochelin and colicins